MEKLNLLEQRVTQMVELINGLQSQKKSSEEQTVKLNSQIKEMTQELDKRYQEINTLNQIKEEHQRFVEERGQVYAKLESMLKGLEGIDV
ncbi:MAG: hypothetical protein HZA78_12915 [Candidatus Schekmanbacteria bacterium]|nr:hypothetical protein [Candidatus Schekmanbacteria bacterium]